jgi:hypothetical protein
MLGTDTSESERVFSWCTRQTHHRGYAQQRGLISGNRKIGRYNKTTSVCDLGDVTETCHLRTCVGREV